MRVIKYTPEMCRQWNELVENSRNATFLFNRSFMDYHSDRFPDHSLMLFDDHDKLIALFPATIKGNCASSHSGLTYGGWILGPVKPDILQLLEAWNLMMRYYKEQGCNTLLYKPIPHIYHRYPAEEDLYALFVNHATLKSALLSSVIKCDNRLPFNTGAKRHVKNGNKKGLRVKESTDFASFWRVLEQRLAQRYDVAPVHTLEEIELLHSRFSDEIKLWLVEDEAGMILGGTVLFLCGRVVKAQYIASTESGRAVNAVDFLFDAIIGHYGVLEYEYVDLGPSCEDGGYVLNAGLVSQKCGYGARGIIYTTYEQPL